MTLETPCPHCDDTLRVEVTDGVIGNDEAREYVGYVAVPIFRWNLDLPFA